MLDVIYLDCEQQLPLPAASKPRIRWSSRQADTTAFGDIVRAFFRRTDGNITIITAVSAPVLVTLIAGAMTLADTTVAKTSLQDALDAAVLAGVAASTDAQVQTTAAEAYFSLNSSEVQAEDSAPAAASFQSNGEIVHGEARLTLSTVLPGLLGLDSVPITVTAAARKPRVPICILGLNGLDRGAFDINGNPDFNAPDCGVQANSGSTRGMTQEGTVRARAKAFAVAGGESTNNFSPMPATGAATVADPYANIPFPSHRECGSGDSRKGLVIDEDTTLKPGVFCGGINITGRTTTVRLEPGVYVMVDGPLLVNGNATLLGQLVTIAFTGSDSTLRVWGNSRVDLTSPTSGTYANMQFFQDRNDTKGRGAWVSIGGNGGPNDASDVSKLKIDGVAYFPTQNFWVYGKADVDINSPGVALVADKIWFQGAASIDVTTNNTRNLANFTQLIMPSRGAWLIK